MPNDILNDVIIVPLPTNYACFLSRVFHSKMGTAASTHDVKPEYHCLLHAYFSPKGFSGFDEIQTNPRQKMLNSSLTR